MTVPTSARSSGAESCPRCKSSPIAVLACHGGPVTDGGLDASPLEPDDADLLVALAGVPDPRQSRGCRHQLVTVLAIGVCAVLAGARSYVAIAEWAHDLLDKAPAGRRQSAKPVSDVRQD